MEQQDAPKIDYPKLATKKKQKGKNRKCDRLSQNPQHINDIKMEKPSHNATKCHQLEE